MNFLSSYTGSSFALPYIMYVVAFWKVTLTNEYDDDDDDDDDDDALQCSVERGSRRRVSYSLTSLMPSLQTEVAVETPVELWTGC